MQSRGKNKRIGGLRKRDNFVLIFTVSFLGLLLTHCLEKILRAAAAAIKKKKKKAFSGLYIHTRGRPQKKTFPPSSATGWPHWSCLTGRLTFSICDVLVATMQITVINHILISCVLKKNKNKKPNLFWKTSQPPSFPPNPFLIRTKSCQFRLLFPLSQRGWRVWPDHGGVQKQVPHAQIGHLKPRDKKTGGCCYKHLDLYILKFDRLTSILLQKNTVSKNTWPSFFPLFPPCLPTRIPIRWQKVTNQGSEIHTP